MIIIRYPYSELRRVALFWWHAAWMLTVTVTALVLGGWAVLAAGESFTKSRVPERPDYSKRVVWIGEMK